VVTDGGRIAEAGGAWPEFPIGLWRPAAELTRSGDWRHDPAAVAERFATDVLAIDAPVVVPLTQSPHSAVIVVRSSSFAKPVSVALATPGGGNVWSVMSATTLDSGTDVDVSVTADGLGGASTYVTVSPRSLWATAKFWQYRGTDAAGTTSEPPTTRFGATWGPPQTGRDPIDPSAVLLTFHDASGSLTDLLVLAVGPKAHEDHYTVGGDGTLVARPGPSEVPAGVDIGPLLVPDHLGRLPGEGIALQIGGAHTVVLIALDGTVLGHLDGFDLTSTAWANPLLRGRGPLVLGRGDSSVMLGGDVRDERLVDVPGAAGATPLADGASLVQVGGDRLRLTMADGTSTDLEYGAIDVSADRHWVTVRVPNSANDGYGSAIARKVVARSASDSSPPMHTETLFKQDCFIADDTTQNEIVLCGDVIRGGLDGTSILHTGGPFQQPGGHWSAAQVSPDGRTLLALFSGECESLSAWYIDLTGAEHIPRLVGPPGTEWDSAGLGWTTDGRASVSFGPGVCGTALPDGPGVYLTSVDGNLTPIYKVPPDVLAWGASLWTTSPTGTG
jgi:hypothetical protein